MAELFQMLALSSSGIALVIVLFKIGLKFEQTNLTKNCSENLNIIINKKIKMWGLNSTYAHKGTSSQCLKQVGDTDRR